MCSTVIVLKPSVDVKSVFYRGFVKVNRVLNL